MDTEQVPGDAEKEKVQIEREQSHTAKLLEHHLKLQQLDRKVAYVQAELDGMEARRRERQKVVAIFLCGVAYGVVLLIIFDLKGL